jgi:hypothetical protein
MFWDTDDISRNARNAASESTDVCVADTAKACIEIFEYRISHIGPKDGRNTAGVAGKGYRTLDRLETFGAMAASKDSPNEAAAIAKRDPDFDYRIGAGGVRLGPDSRSV